MEKAVFNLDLYPEKPGVYLMKDQTLKVIYVGKAKNLRNRLRQYFSLQDNRAMIPFLLNHISVIETIICFSEKEALLLENTLIKEHKPKYNALLKDDKSYICLYLDPKSPWPKLELVRSKEQNKKKGLYFGPYSQTRAAKTAYKILSEYFGLRQCSDYELARRSRPCLLYGMKKCLAPCKGLCEPQEYQQAWQEAVSFLEGQSKKLLQAIKDKIQIASDNLAFEQAAAIYKSYKELSMIATSRQMMIQVNQNDMDIFNLYQEGSCGVLVKLSFRDGKINGQDALRFDETLDEGAALLTRLFLQYYERHEPAPTIVCPLLPEDHTALEDVLKELKKRKVNFIVPQKGDKKAFLELAYENARLSFEQTQQEDLLLLELEKKAKLSRYPDIIDCYDLSHFGGSEPCGVKIRYESGRLAKASKRLFKIKTAAGGDDYAGMQEVLTRSLKQSKLDDNLPDLILIDGGKGQVNIAKKVLEDLDIACCDVIGVVKESARHDKGLSAERLVVSFQQEPLELDKKSPLLFFLQRIRDDAHKAAITFNSKREKTRLITSILDQIPGIGEIKKKELLKHFGSVQKIKQSSLEDLKKAPKITKKDAEIIYGFFQGKS